MRLPSKREKFPSGIETEANEGERDGVTPPGVETEVNEGKRG